MFKRVDSRIFKNVKHESKEEYKQMVELQKQSITLEKKGKVKESTDVYFQALSLLISAKKDKFVQFFGLPRNIWLKIFLSLDFKSVSSVMAVKKNNYYLTL